MADYHTTYKGPEGETTQWEDIQAKLGNLPPKAPAWKPDAYAPEAAAPEGAARVREKGADELSDLEDEFADDRVLEEYRQRRIAEMRDAAARPRFGTLDEIAGPDFVPRVTEASRGYWVVVLLYKAGRAGCGLLEECLRDLAREYPNTRFLKIVSTSCIPNYPDQNLPTVLVYHGGACQRHIIGLAPFGGGRATPEQAALALNQVGPVCVGGGGGEGGGSGGEDAARQVKGLVQRIVEQRERAAAEDDESSDFD
ncbi:MAG: thioredoxin-like protein [Monoraphidium minutum]|nr:MAG: thioredoxin-like protein [Monoraphidium minutum]